MIKMLLSRVKSVHFLASPHFKLESIANMYSMAEELASEQQSQLAGELAPLISNGDVADTLSYVAS